MAGNPDYASRGSSPRTRGTVSCSLDGSGKPRFIPADAGNGGAAWDGVAGHSVHPRGRGERATRTQERRVDRGSSPRTRGTGHRPQRLLRPHRFIPADAGNGTPSPISRSIAAVHPRGRGERVVAAAVMMSISGSSPRTRGTGNGVLLAVVGVRFIPADAGNGARVAAEDPRRAVHPRGRGERSTITKAKPDPCGSSPRTRGTVRGRGHGG